MKRKNVIFARIIFWLILAVIIGWFSYLKIVPLGKISYEYNFSAPNYFIGKPTPSDRVAIVDGRAVMTGDPIYFSLKPPRRFERAKVTVEFKNPTSYPVMEIGLLNDKISWGYVLKPLENKIIDQLALVWTTVKGLNGERLIEREPVYKTVDQFLSHLPSRRQIALYGYGLRSNFKLPDYRAGSAPKTQSLNLRGSYQFYTYIKNEVFNFSFSFSDLNDNKDSDPVEIKVFSPDGGQIFSKRLPDDAVGAEERDLNIKISGLAEGVYRVSFIASDDIITRSLLTEQSRLAFINKVWLAGGREEIAPLYTNSRQLGAQTINPGSLGAINIGEQTLDLSQTYRQFFLKLKAEAARPVKIEPKKDDLIISGDGVFGFSADTLIDPRFKTVDSATDIKAEGIDYVLTAYESPEPAGGWLKAAAEFDLTKAYQENGKYQFMISLPGLSQNQAGDPVELKSIKIDLSGASLWQKLKKIFKNEP